MDTGEYHYRYNGKELVDEIGLYDYGFRYYDPAIGRFTGVDPIADKFPQLSTYNYASNDPIKNIDLHGLQGLHFMDKDQQGIEKNVAILVKPTSSEYSDKKNARISKRAARKVEKVQRQLDNSFSNAKNSEGETVIFKFNVFAHPTDKTKNLSPSERSEITRDLGITVETEDGERTVPAAVITDDVTIQSTTYGNGVVTLESDDHTAHEIGHTLMKGGEKAEEGDPQGTGLMTCQPNGKPGILLPSEVDKMLKDAIKGKKKN